MKRIICSILVVVMLALSFASCGYKPENDDMTDYATFSKEQFEKALKEIFIEDGEFTTEDAKREKAILEVVYAAIADAMEIEADDKLTEGTPNGRDIIYYSYYMTAEFDGKTSYFYTSKMDSSSPVSIQLLDGDDFGDDELSEKIADLLSKYDFASGVYSSVKTSTETAQAGDIACVTYTKTVGDKDPVVYTNQIINIVAKADGAEIATSFESYLCGQKLATSITEYSETVDGSKVYYKDIKINWVMNRVSEGVASEGDTAYVTYTKKVGDGNGEIVKELITVGAAPAEGVAATTIAELVSGKKIGEKLVKDDENKTELTVESTDASGVKTVLSGVTVNWIHGDGEPVGVVKDTPFDEKTLVKDTEGVERDLKDKEISYYIYPIYYVDVPEYSAEFLVEFIICDALAASASSNKLTDEELLESAKKTFVKYIFIDEYADLYYNEDTTSEEMQDWYEEHIAEADKKYVKKSGDKDVNFSGAVANIIAYYKDIESAETAKSDASTRLANAETNVANAKSDLEDAKAQNASEDEIKLLEEEIEAAEKSLKDAEESVKSANDSYDKIEAKKGTDIKFLLEMTSSDVALSKTLYDGYKVEQYYSLQYSYNEEIKNNLAKELYFFITKYVEMNADGDLPSDLVDDAYTKLYESYENEFYTGSYDSSTSNYKKYGSFEKYLIAMVNENEDIKEALNKDAKTFGDAKDILLEYAEYITVPVVQVFRFADAYDMTISDSDYEDYKDEIEDYYYQIYGIRGFDVEEIYGTNSLKMAAQLDKILDWLLAYDDTQEVKVGIYTKIEYKYSCDKLGEYKFGDPASKAGEDAAE